MKRWAIALGVLALLLVGMAAVGLPLVEKHVAGEMRTRIEARGIAKVGGVEVALLKRRIVLSNVAATPPGAEEPTLTAERIEASGLGWPLAEWLAGRTPFTGWTWGDPVSADRVELTNLNMVNDDQELEWIMNKVVVEGIDLPRYQPATTLLPGSLAQEARALSALKVRRVEAYGLALGSTTGEGIRLSVGSIGADGIDRGRIATVTFIDSQVRDPMEAEKPNVSIEEMTISEIDLTQPLENLKAAVWWPGMPIGRVWTKTISLSGFGGELMKRFGVSLDRILIETVRESAGVARAKGRVEGLALRPSGSGREGMQARLALLSLGVREIAATIECSAAEDRLKGELEIDKCVLGSPGLAEASFGARIVNADELFWQALDGGNAMGLIGSKAALGSAQIVVRDDSLLNRLLKIYAESSRQDIVAARAQIALEVRRFMPTDVLITEDLTKLADTVARFVEKGGTLTVTATPDPPLDFERFSSLSTTGPDLVDVLGVKATLSPK